MSDSTQPAPHNPRAEAKAAKAYAKATRPWYRKKRWIAAMVVGVFVVAGAATSGSEGGDAPRAAAPSAAADTSVEDTAAESVTEAVEEEPAKPELTAGQENALRSAEQYLSFAPFSRKGLIRQLSSDAGDGYPKADATFAADNVEVDWNEQAAKAAEAYLELQGFSRDGLIQQLTSDAGDGYTRKQAEYGVSKAGL